MKRKLAPILSFIFLVACAQQRPPTQPAFQTPPTSLPDSRPPTAVDTASPAPTPTPPIPDEVVVYLDTAFEIMYENSIRRDVINWDSFRSRYDAKISERQPQTLNEAHTVIRDAVNWLGDNHSRFLTPDEVASAVEHNETVNASMFDAGLVEGQYGYVVIPSFNGGLQSTADEFATVLQMVIAELKLERPCGWIVDLHFNNGGSMWPMVAGIGPILGEGEFGENTRADGTKIVWRYEDGKAWWGDQLLAQTNNEPVELEADLPPVAVIIGRRTASAGEAVAVAFKARPNVRFFGNATAGLTSAPEPYYLSDGAVILIADSYMSDRTGREYRLNVRPNEVVAIQGTVEEAVKWLGSQMPCR